MADSAENWPINKLVRRIEDNEKLASRLRDQGFKFTEAANLVSDYAAPVKDILEQGDYTFTEESCEQLERSWGELYESGVKALDMSYANSFSATVHNTLNTTEQSMVVRGTSMVITSDVTKQARAKIDTLIAQQPLVELIKLEFVRLSLDSPSIYSAGPHALLDEAVSAMDGQASEVSTTGPLITLRECIESAIAMLIQRRPTQEPAKNFAAKVESIGRQCGLNSITATQFSTLGADGSMQQNELSGTKGKALPREEVARMFNTSLLFLSGFLSSIDETKLKAKV